MPVEAALWEVPAEPHHVGAMRRQVASFAARAGMPAGKLGDLQVAVSEAVTNAVVHAYGDDAPGRVRIEAQVAGGDLLVRVRDYGRGMRARAGAATRGRGLVVIAAVANVLRVRRCETGGTEVSMSFALRRA
jgi:anti-sigma regulatory factor (Ser/Thr protein kinase)